MKFSSAAILAACMVAAGCGSMKDKAAYDPSAPLIASIRIDLLKCTCVDDTLPTAVRNSMIAEFFKRADVQIVKDGPADVVLDGTITYSEAVVAKGKVSAFSAGSGSTGGKYPSGITLMAHRGDTLIATGGYTLPVKPGSMPSAEGMAGTSTSGLIRTLFAKGLKPKQIGNN